MAVAGAVAVVVAFIIMRTHNLREGSRQGLRIAAGEWGGASESEKLKCEIFLKTNFA